MHPEDDPSIVDATDLWRRIHPDWVVPDENTGKLRPSSQAFNNDPQGGPMSIYLEPEVLRSGRSAEDVLRGYPGYAMVAFTAGAARGQNQGVRAEPLKEEPAHGLVVGDKPRSVRQALARQSHWVIAPTDKVLD